MRAALATAAFGGPYEHALAAFDSGDDAAALKLWLPVAEQGHRTAQFNVAVLNEGALVDALNGERVRQSHAHVDPTQVLA